ncbi:hypothetical protein [Streptomyces lycii]|uniref:Uncharacterized protein n=1 Tax=Streptomyces lycii TaxID=2654337 RepID=A0ABQ7FBS7_9ACTN|nr:hypothetical protein [Streptomyces lycii]KAF4406546.1 hypothetical protein GCU69_24390 [Streptomyces lycii]
MGAAAYEHLMGVAAYEHVMGAAGYEHVMGAAAGGPGGAEDFARRRPRPPRTAV